MEKTISFKLQMYDKTDFVLGKYESVWAAKPAFKEIVVLFRENKGLVYENESKQTKSASSSGSKIMARDNMLNLAQLVCNLGITYASSTSDKELMPKFNFSPSELKEGLEKEVSKRCDDISKAALPILDKLIDLGMPADQLDKLNVAVTDYQAVISLPQSIINASKSAKEDMLKYIAVCDDILKLRLDKMMLLFKDTNPDFYNEYFNARYIGGWSRKDDSDIEGNEEVPEV